MSPRSLLAALAVLLTLAILPGSAAACVLRFAWSEWAPYHYRGADGRPTGIDHALVTQAMRRMGCTLEWVEMPRNRAVNMLREGRIDAIAGLGMTEDRLEYSLFSAPLRPGRNVLLVRRGESTLFPFPTLEELADSPFRLGVIGGARYSQEYERLLEAGRLEDNNVTVPSFEAALSMLMRNRIDGFIIGDQVARHLVRSRQEEQEVEFHPMPIQTGTAYVMFSRRTVDHDLVRRFDEALAEMEADGTTEHILNSSAGLDGVINHAEMPTGQRPRDRDRPDNPVAGGKPGPVVTSPRGQWPRASTY